MIPSREFDCDVVIVTHNSERTLQQCLQHVIGQAGCVLAPVLVDNASDRDPATAGFAHPGTRWIRNSSNLGFAAACNQGAALGNADYLLFLNPDCFLPEHAIARMLQHFRRHPELGLLGIQLLNGDGSPQAASRRRAPTPANVILGNVAVAAPDGGRAVGIEWCDAVSGAVMMIPRRLFQRLEGFDAGYRLHCEDLDLCRRVQGSGHSVGVALDVQAVHLKGTSSTARPVWVEWQKHRGMWRYFCKFDRGDTPGWLTALLAVGLVIRFPLAAARAWWRARLAGA